MPFYCYRCTACNKLIEDFQSIPEPRPTITCPDCQYPAVRSYMDEAKNTDLVDNPRWSEAMGCMPHEVPERMRQFPGSVYDSEGRLLIRNRKHKLEEMKRRGFVEY